ncbi:LLM class flavin-dependent oxidoreductase [Actinomadura decatromicini]|uniref:LLM class flavin-dependent oxidoreductase n=1 Tax=Actinomadura decatromicini TaxID=2604572 RepID=A0A5D3FKX5_9ACTN|nr:LLM class flavin-dependent oxidoreductase [Actinomadura decatromicini]
MSRSLTSPWGVWGSSPHKRRARTAGGHWGGPPSGAPSLSHVHRSAAWRHVVEIGISHLPVSPSRALRLARIADATGIARFGVADSSHLFGAMYPTVQLILSRTSRIKVGPFVTNPVTRHPSVHAADVAALAELYSPDRIAVAMGTGDSAVHSVGLRPAKAEDVGRALGTIRAVAPAGVTLELAASGPKAASAASAEGVDGLVLGGGMSVPWTRRLIEAAGPRPLSAHVFLIGHLVEREDEVKRARAAVRASVLAVARHAIGVDMAGRDVPPRLRPGLEQAFARYDFAAHAKADGANERLLDDHPEEEAYLFERFAAVGTPGAVAERLREFQRESGIDGAVLSTTVPDPDAHVALTGERLTTALRP